MKKVNIFGKISTPGGYLPFAAALLAPLPFLGALGHGFVWDDFPLIVDNPAIRELSWANLRWMFTSLYMTTYQPLGWLAYAAIRAAQGLDPVGFHLANLLVHALNAGLVCLLFSRLAEGAKNGVASAAVAALIWAWHPLQAESVVWATELPDLLAAAAILLSVLLYLRDVKAGRFPAAALAAFAVSGLFRWKGIALPAALLAMDAFLLNRDLSRRRVWLEKAAFLCLSAPLAWANYQAKAQISGIRWSAGPADVFSGLTLYLRTFLAPVELLPIYAVGESALPAATLLGGALVLRRRWPGLLPALLCWAAFLLPTFARSAEGLVFAQDHYAYLPAIALAALLAGSSRAWALALIPAALLSAVQTRHWRSETALWTRAAAVDPSHRLAHKNLAAALAAESRWEEAAASLRRHVELWPGDEDARRRLELLSARLVEGRRGGL